MYAKTCGTRGDKYEKVRTLFLDKLYRNKNTILESEMMEVISLQARAINVLERDLITMMNEVDKLRQENVFLLSLVQEDEQGVGDSMVSIGGQ